MKRWTIKRIDAAISACTAMLAGEEGEGDFMCSADDLNAALEILQATRGQTRHYQNGADSCACGNIWPCTRMTGPRSKKT